LFQFSLQFMLLFNLTHQLSELIHGLLLELQGELIDDV